MGRGYQAWALSLCHRLSCSFWGRLGGGIVAVCWSGVVVVRGGGGAHSATVDTWLGLQGSFGNHDERLT